MIETLYYFLATVVMFISIPATIAAFILLYEQRPKKSEADKVSFTTWTFTNPFGAIAFTILSYFITVLNEIGRAHV